MNNKNSAPLLQSDRPGLLSTRWNALWSDERGQGMTEYVIVLVAIAVVCIAISVEFGGKIKDLFVTASDGMDEVDQNY